MLFSCEIKTVRKILLSLAVLLLVPAPPIFVWAQNNANLPVAIAIAIPEAASSGGQIVTFNNDQQSYAVSRNVDDAAVYGITVANPPLLFATATNTTAVVTSGSANVRFTTAAGAIERGDVLVTSAEMGVAQRATDDNKNVFAVALEDSNQSNNGQILVQFDPVTAKALHAEKIEATELALAAGTVGTEGDLLTPEEEEPGLVQKLIETYARGIVAAAIAIGALFFVMYTFRTTTMNATLAVGRNPRARNAIMAVSIGNIVFAVVICVLAMFVALAIIVLPV